MNSFVHHTPPCSFWLHRRLCSPRIDRSIICSPLVLCSRDAVEQDFRSRVVSELLCIRSTPSPIAIGCFISTSLHAPRAASPHSDAGSATRGAKCYRRAAHVPQDLRLARSLVYAPGCRRPLIRWMARSGAKQAATGANRVGGRLWDRAMRRRKKATASERLFSTHSLRWWAVARRQPQVPAGGNNVSAGSKAEVKKEDKVPVAHSMLSLLPAVVYYASM